MGGAGTRPLAGVSLPWGGQLGRDQARGKIQTVLIRSLDALAGTGKRRDSGDQSAVHRTDRTKIDPALARQPCPQPLLGLLLIIGGDLKTGQPHRVTAIAITDLKQGGVANLQHLSRQSRLQPDQEHQQRQEARQQPGPEAAAGPRKEHPGARSLPGAEATLAVLAASVLRALLRSWGNGDGS